MSSNAAQKIERQVVSLIMENSINTVWRLREKEFLT